MESIILQGEDTLKATQPAQKHLELFHLDNLNDGWGGGKFEDKKSLAPKLFPLSWLASQKKKKNSIIKDLG